MTLGSHYGSEGCGFELCQPTQKSNLIESILLGIPVPPIFVSQNEKNLWDVIDGLQRLSTIFEFMGILKDKEDNTLPASKLSKTKFLPSLEGKYWEKEGDEGNSLTSDQRLLIKRSKLDIKIIKTSSDKKAKYDLFQRINIGGTHLSPQEIRNCLLIMSNKHFFEELNDMNRNEKYRECIPLSEGNLDQQVDMEFIVRFIIVRNCDLNSINKDANIHEYLNDRIVEIAQDTSFSIENEKKIFFDTFDYLHSLLGEDVFKKYNRLKTRFEGAVLISAYESIVLGVSKNIEKLKQMPNESVVDIIKGIYENQTYILGTAHGVRPLNRLKRLSMMSIELFTV